MGGVAVVAPTAQRGTGLALGPDETTTEEPPDISRLGIGTRNSGNSNAALNTKININRAASAASSGFAPVSPAQSSFVTPALASSLDSTFRRAYAERNGSPVVPPSPSVADSVGGSASDYDNEHEPDSPSSLSSWNSWAGGRRGDLADVEDLELDGLMAVEPELETVSELDEESSAYMSGSDRPGADSDDDGQHHSRPFNRMNHNAASVGEQTHRRKAHHYGSMLHSAPHPHHPQYHHHVSHLHPHAAPMHPHFSPRAGGNGLSHASRHLQRAPPNLAARRRSKGRLAELAEEGTGNAISTTKMPSSSASESPSPAGSSPSPVSSSSKEASPALPSSTTTPYHVATHDEQGDNAGVQSNIELEIFGPPVLPVRSVSPSETVPVVPSPLCVCLTADEQGEVTEVVHHDVTPTREIVEMTPTNSNDTETASIDIVGEDARQLLGGNSTPTPPSPTNSRLSVETAPTTVSTPPTSPPSSPQIGRKGSLRSRRSSSPGRSKPKIPLRPCFKRRATTEKPLAAGKGSPDSSSDCEKSSLRGRTKVRFSQAPPMEVRTHSPVEYDRKACPVSNRLSPEDLEELRTMKMEMGLLEAKCAALAACKKANPAIRFTGPFGGPVADAAGASSESESEGYPELTSDQRRRADSITSSSPSYYCRNRFAQRNDDHDKSKQRLTPAEYLKMEREKERERVCRMAGIGTGVGFRYSGGSGGKPNTRQMPHGGCEAFGASSIISRFGLSKPPPPLPGMSTPSLPSHNSMPSIANAHTAAEPHHDESSGFHGGSLLYRPNSAPPSRAQTLDTRHDAYAQIPPQSRDVLLDDAAVAEDSPPRGRQMEKSEGRSAISSSTSTDATLTEAEVIAMRSSSVVPSVTRTCPSPPPHSPERLRESSVSPTFFRSSLSSSPALSAPSKPVRPNIRPLSNAQSSPSYETVPSAASSVCGYDSPASEFCYESGSEYDLLG